MLKLILATRNPHKTREFAEILGPEFELSDLSGAKNIPEVEETGRSFAENAILKATAASRFLPGLIVADDSGLEVLALNGAPGIYSARYAGPRASDEENVAKLVREMAAVETGNEGRAARFCCAIALVSDSNPLAIFHGTIEGVITNAPQGEGGFGYDPIFIPRGSDSTFAELGEEVKNRISHRAIAIAKLRAHLGL